MNENERKGNSHNTVNHWDSGKHLFVKLHKTPMRMVTQCYMMNKMNNWQNRLWWQVWLSISENSNRDNQTHINWYPIQYLKQKQSKDAKQPQEEHSLIPCYPVFLCNLLYQCFLLLRCWCKQNSTRTVHEWLWEKVTTFHGSKQLMLHSHVVSYL